MRQKFLGVLLGLLLCLVCVCTAFAEETRSITVTAYELEPGYYLCAVWDGDTLLTLFDAVVGSDGVLNKDVDIGDTPISGNTVKVAISSANIDSEDAAPVIQTNVPVKSSGETSNKPDDSGGNTGGGSTGDNSSSGGTSGSGTIGSESSAGGGGSSKTSVKSNTTPTTPTAPTTLVPSSVFSDVPSNHTFATEIAWARDNGIMNGYSDGTFRPDNNTNRQQMWMVLGRLAGANPSNMTEARTWAVNSGISDGTNPENPMSRQQLVTMLYRFAGSQNMNISGSADLSAYPDNSLVATYATEALSWAVGNGIVTGTTDGRLNPEGTATRAHFAAFLYRFNSL